MEMLPPSALIVSYHRQLSIDIWFLKNEIFTKGFETIHFFDLMFIEAYINECYL